MAILLFIPNLFRINAPNALPKIPTAITIPAVISGIPPLNSVISIAIEVVTDFAASDSIINSALLLHISHKRRHQELLLKAQERN